VAARNPARLVAPLALVAAVIGVIVVVQASTSSTTSQPDQPVATQRTSTQRRAPARARPRFYIVKPGDTLTAVAESTGVTLETIQELNPDVDPQALQAGQRLKLGP
jgi:LysM repeat protein